LLARKLNPAAEPVILNNFIWMRSQHNGFWYPQAKVGDPVKEGQVLGTVKDVWGKELQIARATATGHILFLVSSLAINTGDPLLSIGA
jgi:predicted deacylase